MGARSRAHPLADPVECRAESHRDPINGEPNALVKEGVYRNSAATELFPDRARPSCVGCTPEANARLFGFWGDLTNALQTGTHQNEVTHSGARFFATLSQDPVA
ncbi:hypothetical protein [Streptomyces sp. NPDC058964]|uniref:hypothetical protein n=1 Tax=Streptomyces sp. NPDC058964 TaxID=3346681 RepID=UPI00367F74BF